MPTPDEIRVLHAVRELPAQLLGLRLALKRANNLREYGLLVHAPAMNESMKARRRELEELLWPS